MRRQPLASIQTVRFPARFYGISVPAAVILYDALLAFAERDVKCSFPCQRYRKFYETMGGERAIALF